MGTVLLEMSYTIVPYQAEGKRPSVRVRQDLPHHTLHASAEKNLVCRALV